MSCFLYLSLEGLMPAKLGSEILDKTITVRLTERHYQQLVNAAKARGTNKNQIARAGILAYLGGLDPPAK